MIPDILKLHIEAEKWENIELSIKSYFEQDVYFNHIDEQGFLHLKENTLYENAPYDLEELAIQIQDVKEENLNDAVYDYFNQFYIGFKQVKLDAFLGDFEQVKTRLYPRIFSKKEMSDEEVKKRGYIHKSDFEDTFTLILFALPHHGWLFTEDKAEEYNKTLDEIWQAAEENAASLSRTPFTNELNGIHFHFIGHKHTAAGYLPKYLEKNHPEAIGQFGTLITIPRNGTTVLHAVSQKDILPNAVDMMLRGTIAAYQEGKESSGIAHDAINCEVYWYYQGKIEKLLRHDANNPVIVTEIATKGEPEADEQKLLANYLTKKCIVINPIKLFYKMPDTLWQLLEEN